MAGIGVIQLVEESIFLKMLEDAKAEKEPTITFHMFAWVVEFHESRISTLASTKNKVDGLKERIEEKQEKLVRLNENLNCLSISIQTTKRRVKKVVKKLGRDESEALQQKHTELLEQEILDTEQLEKVRSSITRTKRKRKRARRLLQSAEEEYLTVTQERDQLYEIITDIANLVPLPRSNMVVIVRKTGIRALALLNELRHCNLEAQIGRSLKEFKARTLTDFAETLGVGYFEPLARVVRH